MGIAEICVNDAGRINITRGLLRSPNLPALLFARSLVKDRCRRPARSLPELPALDNGQDYAICTTRESGQRRMLLWGGPGKSPIRGHMFLSELVLSEAMGDTHPARPVN